MILGPGGRPGAAGRKTVSCHEDHLLEIIHNARKGERGPTEAPFWIISLLTSKTWYLFE